MLARTVEHKGGNSIYPLKINPAWAAGQYNVIVVNKQTGEVKTLSHIVSS